MENRFVRLLDFANRELGSQNAFTLSELMDLQGIHNNWATRQYSINGVLKKHGISRKEWSDVLELAERWYSSPPKRYDIVNNDIKAHIKGVIGYLPAQELYSKSVFSGQLSSLFRKGKNGRIQRFKGADGLFRYYIEQKVTSWQGGRTFKTKDHPLNFKWDEV
tara:strand:+ start:314 stop:802 length:489 start_codon:yes stop_codon:yes gene_type:complete